MNVLGLKFTFTMQKVLQKTFTKSAFEVDSALQCKVW